MTTKGKGERVCANCYGKGYLEYSNGQKSICIVCKGSKVEVKNKEAEMWRRQANWIENHWEISEQSCTRYNESGGRLVDGFNIFINEIDSMLVFDEKKDAQAFKDNAVRFCEEKARECEK